MNRLFPHLLCLVLLASPLLAATAAASSTDVAALDECLGPVSVWRESELIDGGSMAGFLEAVRDHQAWLDGKGHQVRIRTWTAFEPPAADTPPAETRADKRVAFGNELVYASFDAYMKVGQARQADLDEAYDAFVQKYRKNTTVKTMRLVCLSE